MPLIVPVDIGVSPGWYGRILGALLPSYNIEIIDSDQCSTLLYDVSYYRIRPEYFLGQQFFKNRFDAFRVRPFAVLVGTVFPNHGPGVIYQKCGRDR